VEITDEPPAETDVLPQETAAPDATEPAANP
jgi:hypothetical protein